MIFNKKKLKDRKVTPEIEIEDVFQFIISGQPTDRPADALWGTSGIRGKPIMRRKIFGQRDFFYLTKV